MPVLPLAITASALVSSDATAGRLPRIAYDNLLEDPDATITATSEDAADFPFEYAYDWKPYTHWKPNAGTQDLTASFTVAKAANYFAFYGTELATNGGSIVLQYSSDGVTYTNAASATSPGDTAPVYQTFTRTTAPYWRVRVVSTPASKIGVVAFGEDFTLPRGDRIGFVPPILGRDPEITNTQSNHGNFLGRSIIRRGSEGAFNLVGFTETFMRESWLPFVEHAESKPFFLLWNPADFPDEAAFCWIEDKIDAGKFGRKSLLDTGFRFRARVD